MIVVGDVHIPNFATGIKFQVAEVGTQKNFWGLNIHSFEINSPVIFLKKHFYFVNESSFMQKLNGRVGRGPTAASLEFREMQSWQGFSANFTNRGQPA
jgi:hypothetical protein